MILHDIGHYWFLLRRCWFPGGVNSTPLVPMLTANAVGPNQSLYHYTGDLCADNAFDSDILTY